MAIIEYEIDMPICKTDCPNGMGCKVNSKSCGECKYYGGDYGAKSIVCNYDAFNVGKLKEILQNENQPKLRWHRCKAGYKFPSDAIVIPDDERTTDRDPRLVRCAVWDSKYILVDELKKLPVDNG